MKKVQVELKLRHDERGFALVLMGITGVMAKLVELFNINTNEYFEQTFTGVVTKPIKKRTRRQLGYWHAEVLPKVAQGMRDLGHADYDNNLAEALLVGKFHHDELIGRGGEVLEIPKRIRDTSEEEMSMLIELTIEFAEEWLGVTVVPPIEWFEQREREGTLTDEQRFRLDELREFKTNQKSK